MHMHLVKVSVPNAGSVELSDYDTQSMARLAKLELTLHDVPVNVRTRMRDFALAYTYVNDAYLDTAKVKDNKKGPKTYRKVLLLHVDVGRIAITARDAYLDDFVAILLGQLIQR
jgi:hypothetical protein